MLTKITTLVALNMLYAQAVVTPGNTLSGTAALPAGYPLATTILTTIPATNDQTFYGGYLCIRQGFAFTFPGVNGAGTPPTALLATTSATMQNYYPTTVAQAGVKQTAIAGEVTGFSACTTLSTQASENATAYSATTTLITNRVVFKADALYANNIATLNIDFVLAATYQVSWLTSETTRPVAAYCDKQITALTATAATLSTFGVAFTGATKCTYFLTVAADGGAPSFAISALGFNAFQLHYAEWSSTDMTGAFLATGIYTGTFTATTYPTPFSANYPGIAPLINAAWPQAAITAAITSHTNWFPATVQVGSVGTFSWYPAAAGPFQSTTTATMDSAQLIGMLDATNASYTTYNSAKSTYDTAKTAYNTALTAEKARVADFFKAMFDPAVTIPARPCQPTMPAAYMGPNVDHTITNAAYTTINATSKALGYGAFGRNAIAKPTLNSGFLSSTPDSTATTPAFTWTGHVFGLWGQGAAAMPADGIAYPSRIIPSGETHGMMVSIFPDVLATAAGTTTAKVDFSVKTVTWRVITSIEAPAAPAASVAPDSAAAAYLAAGAAAIAAVAATLF